MNTADMRAQERTADLPVASVDVTGTRRRRRVGGLIGGGTDGNEVLTSMIGAVLIVLLAVLGITILRIHQLIWLHLFLGLVLVGPIAIKMASTGYRFVRYYTRNPAYRSKGPPETLMRLTAPIVVASTQRLVPVLAGRRRALARARRALVGGVVLAIAFIPQFAPWTAQAGFFHHG